MAKESTEGGGAKEESGSWASTGARGRGELPGLYLLYGYELKVQGLPASYLGQGFSALTAHKNHLGSFKIPSARAALQTN